MYATILKSFVQLSDTELQTVLPHKESINQAKIHTTQGESIYVYLCNGLPLILDVNNRIVPTIYFLWYFPNLLHGFKVSYFVIEKLAQGADLMVPGILKNDSGAAPYGQVIFLALIIHLLNMYTAYKHGLYYCDTKFMYFTCYNEKMVGFSLLSWREYSVSFSIT